MLINAKTVEKGRKFVESQLDKFIGRLNIDKITYVPTYNGQLYHYTALKNLNSILVNNREKIVLWGSRYDCLNDASEGQIINIVYSKTCNKLKNENRISDEFYNAISTVKPNRTSLFIDIENGKPVRCEVDTYVTSFSKEYDLLAMWNYYSKGNIYEGVNFGFDSNSVKTSLVNNTPFRGVEIQICPVIYDEQEQIKLIEELLLMLKEKYTDRKDDQHLRYVIAYKLSQWRMIFKSNHFEHEKEVRIITHIGKKFTDEIPIHYRDNYGYIIPYIMVELNKDSLVQVTFGPLLGDEKRKIIQQEIMSNILKTNDYNAKIEFSNIPVRY